MTRTEDDVEVIERTTAYQGYFRIDSYRLRHRLYAGGWSGALLREVFERGHAVAVLPYDPDLDRVVLIEQFRIGPYANGEAGWMVEPVAGIVEEGETVEAVAHRETHEESGLAILDLVPVADFYVSPGGTSQTTKLYIGHVEASGAGGIYGAASESEDIRVLTVSFDEAARRMVAGALREACAIIGMQWLMLNRDALKRRWRRNA